MKFSRYLKETQTPEWKRAYIDYRGLKKCIKRTAQTITDEPLNIPLLVDPTNEHPTEHHGTLNEPYAHVPGPSNIPATEYTSRSGKQRSKTVAPRHNGLRARRSLAKTTIKRQGTISTKRTWSLRGGKSSPSSSMSQPPHNLQALLPLLTLDERLFFDKVEEELVKVESFYLDREKEMKERTQTLEMQINEMKDHRRVFYEAKGVTYRALWTSAVRGKRSIDHETPSTQGLTKPSNNRPQPLEGSDHMAALERSLEFTSPPVNEAPRRSFSASDYPDAKKKLRKAIIEHYRVLEMLHNYRILNVTGFRKALKKFEKVTKIPMQDMYMKEKVNPSAVGSEKGVGDMMSEMLTLFAIHFVKGDRKRAMRLLRPISQYASHHFSTYRSGVLIGIAIPALVSGIVNSFRTNVREHIGPWDALLFVYGILLVPILLVMIIGLNILTYAHFRINYVFIFELDPRTRLDYREYFEIPSILFSVLCYCFWLSFANIPLVPPAVWPLVWIGFMVAVLFDPFPLLARPSRFWLVRTTGRLFISGVLRVEFADFWLGDQFTSLTFTLSNLYFIPCVYATVLSFNNGPTRNNIDWKHCGSASPHWPIIFIVASLPLIFRAIQSVRRYVDTGLKTHLINGGKYLAGTVASLLYILWRHKGGPNEGGAIFVLWCIFNAFYSLYALAWDLLMDWSVLQPHAKYWMLRDELVFKGYVPMYYFAIVSNAILRFAWISYIPTPGRLSSLMTFIGALIEILRRFQWNFYRLENEHLGNVDQYRVSKEVPLPYSFDSPLAHNRGEEDDEDDDDDTDSHDT